MGKAVYKVLDDKGRTTIPLVYRKAIGISSDEVIRIAPDENGSCLNLSKAEVVDFDSEDPEITQTCIHAAVRTLSMGRKLELAASLLSLMSERKKNSGMEERVLMQKKPVGISQGRNVLIDALYYQNDFMNYVEHVAGKRDRAEEGIRKIPNNNAKVPDGRPESMLDMRIWQLRRCMPLKMRYSTLYQRKENGFGKPGMDEYELVFEGRLEKSDLESMEERMARCTPDDLGGHQLSVSDIVELSQDGDSRFFYAEAEGFREIDLP